MNIYIPGYAQREYESISDLHESAKVLFEKEQYVQAFPLYSQLLSLDNANPELNYRFGVCLLYADRSDTYAPIKYLKKAMNQISSPDIYYHLGFAYHINYYFPAAISNYEEYKIKAGKKAKASFDVDRKIEMCQNGMKMMRSVKDLFVLEKSEVSRKEFFRSYDLHDFGSRIIKKPEEFLNKEDKKQGVNDYILFNAESKTIYYSAYSRKNKDQLDIFKRTKLPDGQWSEALELSPIINSIYDEDYPVIMPDGMTLYFSSKGHNTMGGYDIFKSVFNPLTKEWSPPENINFPFNTPLDDILFVSDNVESTAWFASVRNSIQEKIMVYKVGIVKRPEGSTDLAAIYAKNKELTEDDIRQIKLRAQLNVNISDEEYEEIPVEIAVPIVETTVVEKEINTDFDEIMKAKEQEQAMIDSAKAMIDLLASETKAFNTLRQSVINLSDSKRKESRLLRDDVRRTLAFTNHTKEVVSLKKMASESNVILAKAIKLDYEADELDTYEMRLKSIIEEQQNTFSSLNTLYGDVEKAAIQKDTTGAKNVLAEMTTTMQGVLEMAKVKQEFDANKGGLTDIQYPMEIQNSDSFTAFVISDSGINPTIESYSSNYDEYLPEQLEEQDVNIDSYSNTPSKRVEQYQQELENQAQSLSIQLEEQSKEIENIKSGFTQLSEEEKEEQLVYLNTLLATESVIKKNAEEAQVTSQKLKNDHERQVLSSATPEEKMTNYGQLIETAEEIYNFDKKVFIAAAIPIAAASYRLSDSGQLEEVPKEAIPLTPAFQMSFSESEEEKIKDQVIEIRSQIRADNKQNSFVIRKIDSKKANLEREAKDAFDQGNSLIESARNTTSTARIGLIDQANQSFDIAYKKAHEASELATISEQMNAANANSDVIIQQIADNAEELLSAIKNGDWEETERLYVNTEKAYHNHSAVTDFSDQIDEESIELVNSDLKNIPAIAAYQISNQGTIIKTAGNANVDWTNIENFTNEISSVESSQTNMVLSSNFTMESKQNNYEEIFSPTNEFEGKDIEIADVSIPQGLAISEYSLVKNTYNQVKVLQEQANNSAAKRNIINKYYKETLNKSAELDRASLQALNKEIITPTDIDKANDLSLESKKLLYQASQAANLVNAYDEQILNYTKAIDKSLKNAHQMNTMMEDGNSDEALIVNVNLKRELSSLEKQTVNDSLFNYAVGEVFVSIPEIILKEESKEYILKDGVVERNEQAALLQFFSNATTNKAVTMTVSPLIVATTIIDDNVSNELPNEQIDIAEASIEEVMPENTQETIPESESEIIAENNSVVTEDLAKDSVQQDNAIAIAPIAFESDTISKTNQINNTLETDGQQIELTSSPEYVDVQAYSANQFQTASDYRKALAELNTFSQDHIKDLAQVSNILVLQAEKKLNLSNEKSLLSETATVPETKANAQKESKQYLYESLAIKSLVENYHEYVAEEKEKQSMITETTFEIESMLNANNLNDSKESFLLMQNQVQQFGASGEIVMKNLYQNMILEKGAISNRMDSVFNKSQDLSNESVKLLSQAAEKREEAESKKNAFKRREMMKEAEEMEIDATEFQNQAEKALALGNDLFQQQQLSNALAGITINYTQPLIEGQTSSYIVANQDLVFEGIEARKKEVLEGHLNTTAQATTTLQQKPVTVTDDIHVYERETIKAQMITEEIDLIKREIALLMKTDATELSPKEAYVIEKQVEMLRSKTDSLEYKANMAYEYASAVLATLSTVEQDKAREKGRDFQQYLQELKDRIEVLLSEASTLKERAKRSNNITVREDFYNEAKDKEEIAMYLILEEFEVIAQKNKTRYRKNQLLLQQIMLESATSLERELMLNIFSQIDDYFNEAKRKREKANDEGLSFNMRKMLLQDAYSLEMKALDMQLLAKTMLENHDMKAMVAYQPEEKEVEMTAEVIAKNESETPDGANTQTDNENIDEPIEAEEQVVDPIVAATSLAQEVTFENPGDGTVYKVQFSAMQEIKPISYFSKVPQISAQRVPNSNYIRYFSGDFDNLDDAIVRRNSIRASGYADAFIKSWKDGEEVSLLSLSEDADVPAISLSTGPVNQPNNSIDYSATNISSLRGVYYSVQVGVYSKPRTSSMIYNISPLYHKRMNNGYWVYYSGIYKSIADANTRKNEIVAKGVNDAFIVAFSNGDAVSFAQARQDLSRGSNSPAEENIVILEDASLQIDSQYNIAQAGSVSIAETNNSGMIYKVQVGVYSNPINLSWVSSQLEDGLTLDSFQNSNGKYVFAVGGFENVADARDELTTIKEIVPDAFIIGFKDGNKVYVR